jgi:hypothetical protein
MLLNPDPIRIRIHNSTGTLEDKFILRLKNQQNTSKILAVCTGTIFISCRYHHKVIESGSNPDPDPQPCLKDHFFQIKITQMMPSANNLLTNIVKTS